MEGGGKEIKISWIIIEKSVNIFFLLVLTATNHGLKFYILVILCECCKLNAIFLKNSLPYFLVTKERMMSYVGQLIRNSSKQSLEHFGKK